MSSMLYEWKLIVLHINFSHILFYRFEIPVSFQQTNRPVPVLYSLETKFQLSNSKKMFLLDPTVDDLADEDWIFHSTFSKGTFLSCYFFNIHVYPSKPGKI